MALSQPVTGAKPLVIMTAKVRPALVGRRFLSVAGEISPKLSRVSEWKWRGGVIRAATSVDPQEQDLQVTLGGGGGEASRWLRQPTRPTVQIYKLQGGEERKT